MSERAAVQEPRTLAELEPQAGRRGASAAAARAGLYAGHEVKEEPEKALQDIESVFIKREQTTIAQDPVTVKLELVNVEPELVTIKQEPSHWGPMGNTEPSTITPDLITIELEPLSTPPELGTIKLEQLQSDEEASLETCFDESLEMSRIGLKQNSTAEGSSCENSTDVLFSVKPNFVLQKRNITKDHICEICKKGFEKRSFLNRHLRVHTREKPYTCDTCNKQFSQRCSLTRHELIHTGKKPHSCGTCRKQFANSSYLKVHERSHTGEKPYCCSVCEKRFSVSSSFKRHTRTHEHTNKVL